MFKSFIFYKKILTYHATYANQVHTKRFGIKSFRVLTVTTSRERVKSLVKAAQKPKGLQGIFLVIEHASVVGGDVLELPWINGRGASVSLAG